MRTVLARHGVTDWNVQNRIQGQHDVPLNDTGRRQAERLADALKGFVFAAIRTSDLSRAVDTAAPTASRAGIVPVADARWRECAFGTIDGKPFSFRAAQNDRHPYNDPAWHDPLQCDFTSYGGEHGRTVYTRQLLALTDLHRAHAHDTVLVVGHGRALRILLFGLGHGIVQFDNAQHVVIDFDPAHAPA